MKQIGCLRSRLFNHPGWRAARALVVLCCLGGLTGLVFFSAPAPRASAAEYVHALEQGQRLEPGDILYSPSHAYRLIMQGDGNLVLYSGGTALWSSGTAGDAGASAVMQGDGNLVVYYGPKAVWSSGTANHAGALLDMQDDGNLVIYWDNTAIWSSGTNQPSPPPPTGPSAEQPAEPAPAAPTSTEYVHALEPGQSLEPGDTLYSPSHAYRLIMQGDGNLVLYSGGTALWSSGTAGDAGASAVMQGDGNLVVYYGPKAVWSSGTAHHPGALLDMQDDGNLVIYWNDTAIWSSGTNVKVAGSTPTPGGHAATPGQRLPDGTILYSPSHAYRLVMQGDGNLVVYNGSKAIWSTNTHGHPGASAVMQGDGNLVVYYGSKAIWSSGTAHHPGAILDMQDDGNLVIYYNGKALWSSKAAASSGVTPINRSILARAQSYPDGAGGGECIVWVAKVLSEASSGRIRLNPYGDGYQGTYSANGARQVSSSSATGGDVIQVTPAGSSDSQGEELNGGPLHTAIILKNLGGGNFYVIDSNWAKTKRVQRHDFNPYARSGRTVKIWRFQ